MAHLIDFLLGSRRRRDSGRLRSRAPRGRSRPSPAPALSVLGVLACEQVLGEIAIEDVGGDAPSGESWLTRDGGDAPGEPPEVDELVSELEAECHPGEGRCHDHVLEVCVRVETDRPARWIAVQDCFSAALCAGAPVPRCLTRVCDPEEPSCRGAVPRICAASLAGWEELTACASAAHCSTNADECGGEPPCCLPAPCTAGEVRCNELELQRCSSDARTWEVVERCETNALCRTGLERCSGDGPACACGSAQCQRDEVRCRGSVLERCSPDRTGFEPIEACAGPALCRASERRCAAPACAPGERRCSGAQIQVCREDRMGFQNTPESCASAALCNDDDPRGARCEAPACAPGEFDCAGAQLQTCNGDRTGYDNAGAPCARADLCSAARRRCDHCVPGRRECTPNLDASRVCDGGGNSFGPATPCPRGCIAETGACRS